MLFKRFAKNLLDKEVMTQAEQGFGTDPAYASHQENGEEGFPSFFKDRPFFTSQEIPEEHSDFDAEEPEVIIGENVKMTGELSYQKLLRVDGTFEGDLISDGRLVVGPKGVVKANIDLQEAFISGRVVGNITVKERLVLRGRAEIHGDITAPIISVDEGVSIVGKMHVHFQQPSDVDQGSLDY